MKEINNFLKQFRKDSNEQTAEVRKARIYNLIIGSMRPLREATLSGINETINTIRKAQEEYATTQSHTLSLATFDSGANRPDVRAVIYNKPISEVKEFDNYMPYGSIPLSDAMGQSLTTLHNYIKDDSDATAVVTVLTDGLENASREWNAAALRLLIEPQSRGMVFLVHGFCSQCKASQRFAFD